MEMKTFGSFCCGGMRHELVPARMVAYGDGVWTADAGGGLQVRLELHTPAHNAWEWVIRFENTGVANTAQLTDVNALDLLWDCEGGEPLIFESLKGDDCGGESFMPVHEELSGDQPFHREPTGGRPSNTTAFPYFDLRSSGAQMVCAVGWSGQWRLDITKADRGFRVQAGLQDADFHLRPGETARSPRVLVMAGEGGGDIGDLRRAFRRLELERYTPGYGLPVACQNFDRYFWKGTKLTDGCVWATEKIQMENVSFAAACGMDHYWLDACWFKDGFVNGGVGNYSWDTGFPNGLRPVADRVHSLGMKFIVWFEPERVEPGTEVEREHPEWLMMPEDGKESRLFNLGIPAAADWLFEKIATAIREGGIDFYRQDFNIEPLPFWRNADGEGRRGLTENKHVEALYALWDRLRSRFPGMPIDNCSSGGRRIDLETCMRSVPLWRSDTGCSPSSAERPSHIWNQNQTLGLSRYLACHAIASWLPDANEFRSAMTMGIACDFDAFNPAFDIALARASVEEVKALREDWAGDFYGLTEPTADGNAWAAWQVHNGVRGFALFFRRRGGEEAGVFPLRGLMPEKTYRLVFSDETRREIVRILPGQELLSGLSVTIPRRDSSLLVRYSEEQDG